MTGSYKENGKRLLQTSPGLERFSLQLVLAII